MTETIMKHAIIWNLFFSTKTIVIIAYSQGRVYGGGTKGASTPSKFQKNTLSHVQI